MAPVPLAQAEDAAVRHVLRELERFVSEALRRFDPVAFIETGSSFAASLTVLDPLVTDAMRMWVGDAVESDRSNAHVGALGGCL